jgi:hypothetical protein
MPAPIAPSRDAGDRIKAAISATAIGARGTAASRFASSGFLVGGLNVSRSKGGTPRERAQDMREGSSSSSVVSCGVEVL